MTDEEFAATAAFLNSDFGDDKPPPMHPNRVEAAYLDMRNKGQFYIPQIGAPPISIMDWRDSELARWETHQKTQRGG